MATNKQKVPAFLIVVTALSAIVTLVTAFFTYKAIGTESQIYAIVFCAVFALCTIASFILCQKSKTLPSRKEVELDDDEDDE